MTRLLSRRRLGGACVAAVVAVLTVTLSPAQASPTARISAGSEHILATMLASDAKDAEAVSAQFLGTPYAANTLVGSATEPEQLVVELQRVDCFTYADYVEALKRGDDRDSFLENLTDVRYKDGVVAFENRRHFFTDWAASSPALATDVTAAVSDDAVRTSKNLNQKDSGGVYLPGLPVVARDVSYIPSGHVDDDVVSQLRTGDYVGAYAEDGGLDVTHVGIFIDTPAGPVFRNASSLDSSMQVVDTPLADYVATVPGIVVLRPLR
ncbi:DUF1460 domain-containing protein [Mycobacterium sp. SMC-4]|uniref:DUF1460 domain-containing protein n=1 Tax=Mycobacterium sp. SMC-4 TaxID=2857059 RepID=UPI003CFF97B7